MHIERTCFYEKKESMEVSSTIAKTFKRFTIPRSTSSIGSFTTSNGTATSKEANSEASTPSTSSNHKHPPLSYAQHLRSVQKHHSHENLTARNLQEENYNSSHRPLSGDKSSFMIRSASIDLNSSTNAYKTKKSKVNCIRSIMFDILYLKTTFR